MSSWIETWLSFENLRAFDMSCSHAIRINAGSAGMEGSFDILISGVTAGFEPAGGVATLSGVAVETDDATGLAVKVAPVRVGGRLAPALPEFWTG